MTDEQIRARLLVLDAESGYTAVHIVSAAEIAAYRAGWNDAASMLANDRLSGSDALMRRAVRMLRSTIERKP